MAKIIPFSGISYLDIPPDKILEGAKGKLEGVILVGYDKDEGIYCASSYADGGTVLWLLEKCKQKLLKEEEE